VILQEGHHRVGRPLSASAGIAGFWEHQLGDQEFREGLDIVDPPASPQGQLAEVAVAARRGYRGKDLVGEPLAILEHQRFQLGFPAPAVVVGPVVVAHKGVVVVVFVGAPRSCVEEGGCSEGCQEEDVNVGVVQAYKALQCQLSEGGEQGRREKVIESIGRQLVPDVAYNQRPDENSP